MRSRIIWLLLVSLVVSNAPRAEPTRFTLPLDDYPLRDGCLGWGGLNPRFPRCGEPGKHVADDACAPNGTPVLAVADGRLRLATVVGDCFDNWGWITVVEHTLEGGATVCSIYGHCAPVRGVQVGMDVTLGHQIAEIDNVCLPHIHFGIYAGAYAAPDGVVPDWLFGYLPEGTSCGPYAMWPGNYVDPVAFVLERVDVAPRAWTRVKVLFR